MSDETTGTMTRENESLSPSAPTETVQTNGSRPSPPVDEMELALQQMPPLNEIEVPGGEEKQGRRGGRRGNRDSDSSEFRPGQVVKGKVVLIDNEGVLVDIGAKSEGLIRPGEISREPVENIADVVQVDSQIDVLILEPEKDGRLLLSKKRADFEKSWDKIQDALRDGTLVQALVSERVRGGLVVDLGIRGFVPASHVGNGKLKNLDKFVGQTIPLKVLEVDRQNRKVVLSHRLATEEEREREKQNTINALGEGQVRTGTVRRVTDYGAFVDLGGIDGLLHVSEMRWTRVKHPSDIVKVGDQVEVMILKLNLDQGRVSLGMRQILPDPWDEVSSNFHVNDTVEGEVTRLVPFGAFIQLEGGIEGIIPNSELAHRRISKPADVVEIGQMVQVKVIDIRPEERRLTLSLRALQPREPSDEPQREPREPRGRRDATGGGGPVAVEEPGGGRSAGGGTARRRDRGDRVERPERGGRGREDDGGISGGGGGGGGDYRQYMSRDSGSGFTIGDILGDMFSSNNRQGGKKKSGGKRRQEEDEYDEYDYDADYDDAAYDDTEATETEASAADASEAESNPSASKEKSPDAEDAGQTEGDK